MEIISCSTEDFYGILAPCFTSQRPPPSTPPSQAYPPPLPLSQPTTTSPSLTTDLGSAYPRIRTTTTRMGKQQRLRASEPYSPLNRCQDEAKQGQHNTDWLYYSVSKPLTTFPLGVNTHPGWRGNITLLKHTFYIRVLTFLHALPLP